MRHRTSPLALLVSLASLGLTAAGVAACATPPSSAARPNVVQAAPLVTNDALDASAPETKPLPLPATPTEPAVEGAPAPTPQPIDPKYPVDGSGLLLGLTPTELWLLVGDHYTVVVDRGTGCATEGYAEAPGIAKLSKLHDAELETALKDPDTLQGIRDMVGVGRRVGALGNPYAYDMVWSPDGRFIAFTPGGLLYRSKDGGRSFKKVDKTPRSRLAVSNDGAFLMYQEDQTYFSVPIDGSHPRRAFAGDHTFLVEMRPGAQAFFWRSDTEMCADIFDLSSAQLTSSTCLPVPKAATGSWPGREWESISPNGKYGIVKWEEGRKNLAGVTALTYVLALVDMQTKTTLKTVLDMRGEVDDDGNMVMSSMSEGGGDHTYYYPLNGARRLLGKNSLMAWDRDGKTAIMSVWRKAPLASRKCDLVKMVKTP